MQVRIPSSRFHLVVPCVVALAVAAPVASAGGEAGKASLPTALRFTSPLAAYRRFAEQPVGSWREANDNVGRAGGWRAYASELQESTPANVPAKEDDPHAGHHRDPSK